MNLALPRDTSQTIISGTDSFRTASRKLLSNKVNTIYNNYGGNRQNIEKDIRRIWVADPGYKLIQVDQAGAEALIVAYLCRPAKYRTLFKCGIKPHTYLAFKLFPEVWAEYSSKEIVARLMLLDIPTLAQDSDWKKLDSIIKSSDNWAANKRYYFLAKKVVHASSYGMRENTFRLALLKETGGTINLSFEDARRLLSGFHREFPEIQEWHSRLFEEAKRHKVIRNLFGFPFNITDYIDPDDFKDLIAWKPQSTVACITRGAVIKTQEYVEQNNKRWHFLQETHDSFLMEAPEGEEVDCAKVMKESIEVELTSPFDGVQFRMKSEAQVGKNWAPMKKKKLEDGTIFIENPDGLIEIKL